MARTNLGIGLASLLLSERMLNAATSLNLGMELRTMPSSQRGQLFSLSPVNLLYPRLKRSLPLEEIETSASVSIWKHSAE